jgi:hypothetical protein
VKLLGVVGLLEIEIVLGVTAAAFSLLAFVGGALMRLNSIQDELVSKFGKIDTQLIKLRGELSLRHQSFYHRLDRMEEKCVEIEMFQQRTGGFKKRKNPPENRNDDAGINLWNETSSENDTQL